MTTLPKEQFTCKVLDDFVDTIRRLLEIAWGPGWGEFTEEAVNFGDSQNVRLPYITFHLVSREPHDILSPLKKRYFQTVPDPLYEGHYIEIWRRWYECLIRFYCYERTNREARALANKLEVFIDSYVGFFKERGLSELIFKSEEAPDLLDSRFGNLSVRALNYSARVEEVHIVRGKLLEEVALEVKNIQNQQ